MRRRTTVGFFLRIRGFACSVLAALALASGIAAHGSALISSDGSADGASDGAAGAPERTPNIVIILADDLGSGDISALNPDARLRTPHIDRLVAHGMRFTDAHSPSAVCTPTRYGLLTGRYAWRTALTRGVLQGYDPPLIEPDRATIASFLREHGYRTAAIGKWHLGLGWAVTDPDGPAPRGAQGGNVDFSRPIAGGPRALGFDEFFGIAASLDMPPYCWIEGDRVTAVPDGHTDGSGGQRFWRAGAIAPDFDIEQCLPELTDRAVDAIARFAAGDEPFLVYVPITAPHTPHLPIKRYRGASEAGIYGDFVMQVDETVGRIVAAVDDAGASEETIVIFTSDNGAHWPRERAERFGHEANAPWRGQKADIHEGGHRVPFVVRWPGVVEPGSACDVTIAHVDLLATCAQVIGRPLPAGAGEDSHGFAALLRDPEVEHDRPAVVHHSFDGMFAVREGDWKLVLGRGSGGFTAPKRLDAGPGEPQGQLFDLVADPGEADDRYRAEPGRVAALSASLAAVRGRSPRPNVLVLYTDDQRWDTLSALGHPDVRTPNMDRIARRGTAFTSAYVMGSIHGAVCMPSRAMLMTGRGLHQLPESITALWTVPAAERGTCSYPFMPEIFRSVGYRAFGTGKWHNGRPSFARCFDDGDAIFFGGMSDHDAVPIHDFDPTGAYDAPARPGEGFSSTLFADAAIGFLEERTPGDEPFLCYVAFTAPHDPRMAPEPWAAMYPPARIQLPPNVLPEHPFPVGDLRVRDEKLAPFPRTRSVILQHMAAYYAMISHLDHEIGRILDALERTGELEHTIVVLAGDNGLSVGQHGLLGKQNLYEHGVRVPLLFAGPGVPEGTRVDAPVYLHDILPTLCELAGVETPDSVESRSLVPLMHGDATAARDAIYLTYSTRDGAPEGATWREGSHWRAVRSGRWKLMVAQAQGTITRRLFDLETDPWEMRDRSADPEVADIHAALEAQLEASARAAGDPVRIP